MPARYGSDLVVDLLKVLGIEYVALNPGSSFRGIHDSLVNYESGRQPNPEMILCCHEEIAVAVAHGYAKATGKIMPAIVHNVVGLQHASMAIYNAWCDHTPVMVMGGTGPMNSAKRRPWIDWIHTAQVQGNLVRDFVKWDDQPVGIEAFPSSIMRGYRIAMSDPGGPVYLCFDVTDQEAAIEKEIPLPDPKRFRPAAPLQADYDAIKEAAQLLASAQNPVILADYVGRTKNLILTILIYALFTGLAALAQDWWHLAIYRYLTALGIGGEWAAGAAIVAETWPEDKRAKAAGILQSAWAAGFFLAATFNLLLHDYGWRMLFLVGVLPAFVALLVRWGVKEPVGWIRAHGKNVRSAQAGLVHLSELFRSDLRRGTLVGSILAFVAVFG